MKMVKCSITNRNEHQTVQEAGEHFKGRTSGRHMMASVMYQGKWLDGALCRSQPSK